MSVHPNPEDLRDAMLGRAGEYVARTGTSLSKVGKAAIGDGAFFADLRQGRNFTVGTYTRVMDWLDANWPAQERAEP